MISTFSLYVKKIKEKGIKLTLKTLSVTLFRMIYYPATLLIYKEDIEKIDLREKARIDVKYSWLTLNDIEKIAALNYLKENQIEEFFKKGSRCLGAFSNDQLVAFMWIHFNYYYLPLFDYRLELGGNNFYAGQSYVDPKFRGNRLQGAMGTQLSLFAKENKFSYAYICIRNTNINSLKGVSHLEAKVVPVAYLKIIRVFKKIIYKKEVNLTQQSLSVN